MLLYKLMYQLWQILTENEIISQLHLVWYYCICATLLYDTNQNKCMKVHYDSFPIQIRNACT